MRIKKLRLGVLAAMLTAAVGGAALLADTPEAQACHTPQDCLQAGLPDLRVTSIDVDKLGNGQTRIEFWVKNEGTVNSNGGMFRVDIAGVGVWWGIMGSVTVGATKYYSFNIASPPAPPNFRNVQVCADASGVVSESQENDNCLTTSEQFDSIIILPGS